MLAGTPVIEPVVDGGAVVGVVVGVSDDGTVVVGVVVVGVVTVGVVVGVVGVVQDPSLCRVWRVLGW
jgi:hypothetical protein